MGMTVNLPLSRSRVFAGLELLTGRFVFARREICALAGVVAVGRADGKGAGGPSLARRLRPARGPHRAGPLTY